MRFRAILFGCTLPLFVAAQNDTAHWSIKGRFDRFTTDDLGNLYTLQGNVLDLYDRFGRHLARNSQRIFGAIDRIDGFSSLKPMIFSRAQGQLAVLDNTLSIQGPIVDLPSAGWPAVGMACMSVQNRFWFFDEREGALVRTDALLRTVANTGRLDQLLGVLPRPGYMLEAGDKLYMVDPANGVFVFDLFGTPLRTLPIYGADHVQVREGAVWHVAKDRLLRYDLLTLETEEVPWPNDGREQALNVLDARVEHGRIYRLTEEGIFVDRLP